MANLGLKPSLVVYSTGGKYDILPSAAQAILGEYAEFGQNHGKFTYKRVAGDTQKAFGDVFIFYWDSRDGKDLNGWWFGDKVGAGQVWASCKEDSGVGAAPPEKGWRCPVEGEVVPQLVCMPRHAAKQDLKRPVSSDGDWYARKQARGDEPQVLTLRSSMGKDAPDKIKALSGAFFRRGHNHGKRTYFQQKSNCWLYYWDNRDGQEFSGWWLGRRVGGTDVFGVSRSQSHLPPEKGWYIPHDDGKPRRDVSLLVGSPEDVQDLPEAASEDEEVEVPDQGDLSQEDALGRAKELVEEAEVQADKAVSTAQGILGAADGDLLADGVRAACELLQARAADAEKARVELDRLCAGCRQQRRISKQMEGDLTLLEERLQQSINLIRQELPAALEQLKQIEDDSAELRDGKDFQAALEKAMEAVAEAELQGESTDSGALARARQILAKAAGEVKRGLECARSWVPATQRLALKEFGELQDRCKELEQRLGDDAEEEEGEEADLVEPQESLEPVAAEDELWDNDDEDLVDNDFFKMPATATTTLLDEVGNSVAQSLLARRQLLEKTQEMELETKNVLETARVVLTEGSTDLKAASLCLQLLEELCKNAKETQEDITEEILKRRRGKSHSTDEEESPALTGLGIRLRSLQVRLRQELSLARRRTASIREAAASSASEEALLAATPLLEVQVSKAEEAAEAAVNEGGDVVLRRTRIETAIKFPEEFRHEIARGLDKAQQLVEKSQAAIDLAHGRLDAHAKAVQSTVSDAGSRKVVLGDVAGLRLRLQDASKSLGPYLELRSELDMQFQAKEELDDIAEKMSSLESELENLKSKQSNSQEEVHAAGKASVTLQAQVRQLLQLLSERSGGLAGERLPLLQKQQLLLTERGRAAEKALEELQAESLSFRLGAAATALAARARQDAAKAQDWQQKLQEIEALWAEELLPEAEADAQLSAADEVASRAEPELRAIQGQLQDRLLDSRRLPEGSERMKTVQDIQAALADVESLALKISQLKVDTFARRTKARMPDAVRAVRRAEAEVRKVSEAAAPLVDNLEGAAADSLKMQTVAAELERLRPAAEAACTEARAIVARYKADRLEKESPSFHTQLAKLATRLSEAEAKVASCCEACTAG
eukprot:TRINITY_DN74655_c0_g1_i1.p1 TRINITY_DN74655_c0_g1~~TRINITY_DN74655_c0_g1_i1.p1  ORF type:complete len:1124 (-),score=305.63 TRINITY_DN74655_c0_g1_i1:157-3528(-)